MTDYTPTTAEICQTYSLATSSDFAYDHKESVKGQEAKFDRWLAEVERAAAEKAWWEGQRAGWEECADPGAFVNDLHDAKTPNPYRKETP